MSKYKGKRTGITFRIPDELRYALQEIREDTGIPVNDQITDAVTTYVKKLRKPKKETAA